MLESVASGLSAGAGKSSSLSTAALAKYGALSCAGRVHAGQSSLAGRLRKIRRTRSALPLEHGDGNERSYLTSPLAQFRSYSSSHLLTGAFGLAVRHALRPSRQMCSPGSPVLVRRLSGAGGFVLRRGKGFKSGALEASGMLSLDGLKVESASIRSIYGWWGSSWNSRSTRWLHSRHSVWLMFGVCACFSDIAGAPVPVVSPTNPVRMEADSDESMLLEESTDEECSDGQSDIAEDKSSEQPEAKQVYTDYTVTGMPLGLNRTVFFCGLIPLDPGAEVSLVCDRYSGRREVFVSSSSSWSFAQKRVSSSQ